MDSKMYTATASLEFSEDPNRLILRQWSQEVKLDLFNTLVHYESVSRGQANKVGAMGQVGGAAAAVLTGGIAFGVGGPSVAGRGASAGYRGGNVVFNWFSSRSHKEKAETILRCTQFLDHSNRIKLAQAVTRSAVEIFIMFEPQFMQKVPKHSDPIIGTFARDAVDRLISYVEKYKIEFDYGNLTQVSKFITHGILYGETKFKDRCTQKLKETVCFLSENWTPAQMFEFSGAYLINVDDKLVHAVYKRKNRGNATKYGHRLTQMAPEMTDPELNKYYKWKRPTPVDSKKSAPHVTQFLHRLQNFEELCDFCTILGEDLVSNAQLLYRQYKRSKGQEAATANFSQAVLLPVKGISPPASRLAMIDAIAETMSSQGDAWSPEMFLLAHYAKSQGSDKSKIPRAITALTWDQDSPVVFKNAAQTLSLDSSAQSVYTHEPNGCANQRWRATAHCEERKIYISFMNCATGFYLDSNWAGEVYTLENNRGVHQRWEPIPIIDADGRWFLKLKNKATNRYLDSHPDEPQKVFAMDGENGGSTQFWTLIV